MEETCALVVPEINIEDIKAKRKLVANPNCSTIQSVLALKPLEDAFKITRINYSTYQAVSGSGKKGLNDWEGAEKGEPTGFYPYDISRTCIPEIDVFFDDGYSKEEKKMIEETRKILHRPDLRISATCIRVPVPVAHGVLMEVEFEKPVTPEEARKVLAAYPGIKVLDDPKNHIYPVSTIAAGNDLVYVGRIRKDTSVDNGLLIYCVADNVRKGAAANAVQIVKKLIEEKENA
jgi:aspartate-semialdehyde dehydrogenase